MIARGCSSRRVNAYADQGPSQAACVLRFQTYVVNVGSDNELDAGFAGWCSGQQTQSSSALTHLFRRDKIESLRWLHVIKFPPFTIFGLPPWQAA